jgi:hypothetical protein
MDLVVFRTMGNPLILPMRTLETTPIEDWRK